MFANVANNMMERMFRRVDGLCWDMQSGKMAIKTRDGLLTAIIDENDPENTYINNNLISEFGMAIPAFAQGTKTEDIRVGDIIINNTRIQGWVISAEDLKFKIISPTGNISRWNPPRITMMGFDSGTMVVRSLFNMVGGQGVQSMQNMMMPMMMSGLLGNDEDSDNDMMEMMMPMMLMQMTSGQAAGGSVDPSAMMGGNMMQTMMTLQMLKQIQGGKKPSRNPAVRVSMGNDDFDGDQITQGSGRTRPGHFSHHN